MSSSKESVASLATLATVTAILAVLCFVAYFGPLALSRFRESSTEHVESNGAVTRTTSIDVSETLLSNEPRISEEKWNR